MTTPSEANEDFPGEPFEDSSILLLLLPGFLPAMVEIRWNGTNCVEVTDLYGNDRGLLEINWREGAA